MTHASRGAAHADSTVSSASALAALEISGVDPVNYALAHNRVPIVQRVVVTNAGAVDLECVLTVELTDSEGELAVRWNRPITVRSGEQRTIDDVELRADPAALLQVEEERPGVLRATLRRAGELVAEATEH